MFIVNKTRVLIRKAKGKIFGNTKRRAYIISQGNHGSFLVGLCLTNRERKVLTKILRRSGVSLYRR